MKPWITLLVILSSALSGEVEVIKIAGNLDPHTRSYFWPAKTQGGIYIDNKDIYIADGNRIYIQDRHTAQHTWTPMEMGGKDSFKIYSILKVNNTYYLNSIWGNGRFYLSVHDLSGRSVSGLKPKHGSPGRMFGLRDDKILVSGNYRPLYAYMLDRYDTNSALTEVDKKKFNDLFLRTRSFTVAVYTADLKLMDSLNVIHRNGVNGELFDRLWTTQAIDMDTSETLYLVDNDQGYVIEKYVRPYTVKVEMRIENALYKPIPDRLTHEIFSDLQQRGTIYSVVYGLYVKGDRILTTFYEKPSGRDAPSPPYGYNVSTLSGEPLLSSSLPYPIIAEDDEDKVFFYVTRKGGWFKPNQEYLVGMTLGDISKGLAKREAIDREINEYEIGHGVAP